MVSPNGKMHPLPGWEKRPGTRPGDVDQDTFRRRRIHTATADLVVERGFRETKVRDITARAHVGVASFYSLFSSKLDAYLGMFDETVGEARARVARALALAGAAWPLSMEAALEAFLAYAEAEPARVLACIDGAYPAGPEAIERYERGLDFWVELLRGGRCHPLLCVDHAPALEEGLIAGAARVLRMHLRASDRFEASALAPALTAFLAAAYNGGTIVLP